MILVDTTVWIEHLWKGSERLRSLLYDEQVLCHPFVWGELACGTLHNRQEILSMIRALPEARVAEQEELLRFLEARRLYGRGLGWAGWTRISWLQRFLPDARFGLSTSRCAGQRPPCVS